MADGQHEVMASVLFIRSEPGIAFVGVEGRLDETAGRALVEAAATAADSSARHVCLDLDHVTEWTPRATWAVHQARQAVVSRRGSALVRADTPCARSVLGEVGLGAAA